MLGKSELNSRREITSAHQCDVHLSCSWGDHCDVIKLSGQDEYPLRIVPSSMGIWLAGCRCLFRNGVGNWLHIFLQTGWSSLCETGAHVMHHSVFRHWLVVVVPGFIVQTQVFHTFCTLCKLYRSIKRQATWSSKINQHIPCSSPIPLFQITHSSLFVWFPRTCWQSSLCTMASGCV